MSANGARPSAPLVEPKPRVAPRLALSIAEACASLGVSWGFWDQHIAPEIKVCRVGRRQIVAVSELQAWLDQQGERIEV